MPTVYIRRSFINNLTPLRKRLIRLICRRLQLGEPFEYLDGSVNWYGFDDSRFDINDIALMASVIKNISTFPDFNPDTVVNVRAEAIRFVKSLDYVEPSTLDLTNSDNPWQTVINAQGANLPIKAW